MALLRNKKNTKVVKKLTDESLISIYLGTNEWEIIKEIKSEPVISSINYGNKNSKATKKCL